MRNFDKGLKHYIRWYNLSLAHFLWLNRPFYSKTLKQPQNKNFPIEVP